MWLDTHCHLDAAEFAGDAAGVIARARAVGVSQVLIPAVSAQTFDAVRALAHAHDAVYALGIHPLCVHASAEADLERLDAELARHRGDPRLVAVGEIGLDGFVPGRNGLRESAFYLAQLRLAQRHGLPVILHARRSADALWAGLRRHAVPGGIVHAFNGSVQQAQRFIQMGLGLGFGGAMTFERARRIRAIAQTVPASALVLETDAPDIPPHWLYQPAAARTPETPAALTQPNEPAELPRIAQTLAALRGWSLAETAARTTANALAVLPRWGVLRAGVCGGGAPHAIEAGA